MKYPTFNLPQHSFEEHGIEIVPIESILSLPTETIAQMFDDLGHVPSGGFSAYGSSLSFHHPVVRDLRHHTLPYAYALLRRLPFRYVHLIVDRLMYRSQGKQATAEAIHRDLTPTDLEKNVSAYSDDVLTGGWINLNDTEDQHFVCVPGSHRHTFGVVSGSGFVITKNVESFRQDARTITIPPRHLMVFDQRLLHIVLGKAVGYDQKRLFCGFRFTEHPEHALVKDLRERFEHGMIVPLKSSQMPPMYPKLHLTNWPERLIEFSQQFHNPNIMEQKTFRNRKLDRLGIEPVQMIVRRFCPSITELGESMTPYTEEEIGWYFPHR